MSNQTSPIAKPNQGRASISGIITAMAYIEGKLMNAGFEKAAA